MAPTHDLGVEKLFSVKGFVCVITGGGTGIGLMAAQALAANGAKVYITGRRPEALEAAAKSHSPPDGTEGQIIPCGPCDVTKKDDIEKLYQEISKKEKYINLLTGIAGTKAEPDHEHAGSLKEKLWNNETFETWNDVYNADVSSVYFTTVAFLPLLQAGTDTHGHLSASVIVISSMSGIMRHAQGHFSYNAAKGGTVHLTKLMSAEFQKARIRVNSIAPGYFPSEMTAKQSGPDQKSHLPDESIQAKGHVPAERAGSDEEMAQAVLFLTKNAYVNGEILAVDGGVLNVVSGRPQSRAGAHGQNTPGSSLPQQQLGDCLGKGAFGSVYRALNWGTGETVAIKQVKLADLPKNELRVIMLEIDLLKNLNHPNIVKYHGFVKDAQSLYIILEYCENGSLHTICKNFGKFPENLVAIYMSQVLHGLLYLHDQGVIHRDIKGANILTTKEGLVKLADFGVATKTAGLHDSSVVGTPYWMAPEVIELSGATTASDIWSLGCTVIELLDGKPPYHKLQPMPALFRIVNDDHPPLPEAASPKDPNLRVSAKKLLKHPWIVNARRADEVVQAKPTKYDEAVKSVQEWNEALKLPANETLRRASRPMSSSPGPPRREPPSSITTPVPTQSALRVQKMRPAPEVFAAAEEDDNDNWDDDFASSISASALQLPHLRPHDNFAGLLSSEKLKAYATGFDTVSGDSNTDSVFGDSLTLNSPSPLDPFEGIETIRPSSSSKQEPESGKSSRTSSAASGGAQEPRTQFFRGMSKSAAVPPINPRISSFTKPTAAFRENSVEDYSDLIAPDDAAFQRKLESLQARNNKEYTPRLFHPSDLTNKPRSAQNGKKSSSLPRNASGSSSEGKNPTKRPNLKIGIEKYAEREEEDFSDVFGNDCAAPALKPKHESDSGSERGTLRMMNSKLSGSWLGDEEDEEDPFAQLEEGFDEMDQETNVARDRHARLCSLVENRVSSLKSSQPDDVLDEVSDELLSILLESPETKNVIISSHGMLPILEILENMQNREIILNLLKIVNIIILDNVEIQENLCFVGGIPIISHFAHKKFPSEIRQEAAAFVRQMYQTSTLTLQMFIGCGGLNVLVEFLEEDLEDDRDFVLIGVNGVWSVFNLQGPTPKNDFCRIFSRSSVLYPLSLVLSKVLEEDGEVAELLQDRIVGIFMLFSQAETHVKELVADRMVLKRVLKDLQRMRPANQISMLKFIKNLSMLTTTHEALQNSNAIEVLTDLLKSSMKMKHFREVSNQILNILYNLCRLSKPRQEDAALNGVIPLLQTIVKTEWPLKEFALPILCDMAHSGKVGRKVLWQNKGLQFYISLLSDKYWQVTALDAIFIWLQEETARVEQALLHSFPEAIISCFTNQDSSVDAFENLLEPLQKLLRLSPPVAALLARRELFSRVGQKLHTKKPVVRLNLLRIVRSICDATEENGGGPPLIQSHGLLDAIKRLAESDPAILIPTIKR
ncbi:Protein kinase of the Mitotic Exit Network [Diplodia intermedia]|uniref:non-specific serine/threonine protein kinase n=1 Tax=Diplodia intermedia TaxID=856260 RepID=A0ABR3TJT2_9PEZI